MCSGLCKLCATFNCVGLFIMKYIGSFQIANEICILNAAVVYSGTYWGEGKKWATAR
jgi:hypothetical protein